MHRYLFISDIFIIFKIMFCWKSVCKVTQGILSLANGNVEDQQRWARYFGSTLDNVSILHQALYIT